MLEEKKIEEIVVDPESLLHYPYSHLYYGLTFTYSKGLSDRHITNLLKLSEISSYYLCCLEKHQSGALHAHAVIRYDGKLTRPQSITTYLRRKIRKHVYDLKKTDDLHYRALKIQSLKTSLCATIGYCLKDTSCENDLHVNKGFTYEWLYKQYIKWFDSRRKWGKVRHIKTCDAHYAIIEFSKKYGIDLTQSFALHDFAAVVCNMAAEGVNVIPWKKDMDVIYALVKLHVGERYHLLNWIIKHVRDT